jgi:hypothetical protein
MAIIQMENWDEFPTLAETAFKSYSQLARPTINGSDGGGTWGNLSANRAILTALTQGKNGIGKALSVALVRESIDYTTDGGNPASPPRHNTGALFIPTSSVHADGATRFYCGWFKLSNLGMRYQIFQLENTASGSARLCLTFGVDPTGHIYAYNGTANVSYDASIVNTGDNYRTYLSRMANSVRNAPFGNSTDLVTPPVSANTWHFMELRYKAGAAGEVELRIDNQVCFNVTTATRVGINTIRLSILPDNQSDSLTNGQGAIAGSLATVNTMGVVTTCLWDSLFVMDTTGSTANTFTGPATLYSLFPSATSANGEGGNSEFTAVGAANQHTAVASMDADTSYVQGSAPGNITFDFGNLPVAGDVLAVAVSAMARKTGIAAKTLQFKTGASEASAGAAVALTGSYLPVEKILHTNPETSAAWTKAQVDALQVKLETAG